MIIRPDGAAGFVQGGNSFGTTGTLGTNDAQNLVFETGGTEKIRIQNSNGYVAIGSGTPLQKLHVIAGDILIDNNKSYIALDSGGSGWEVAKITASDVMQFGPNGAFNNPMTFYTNGGERMRITAAGDVGIGITPTQLLHIYQASAGTATVGLIENGDNTNATSDAKVRIKVAGTSGGDPTTLYTIASGGTFTTGIDNDDSDKFKIAGSNTLGTLDFMTITATGEVGIGTAAPTSTLHNDGSFALAYVAKTATYTFSASDYTVNCTANTFTVNLPTAVGITGRIYVLKNSGTGVITLDADGTETIDGLLTKSLNQWSSLMVQSDGANWIILSDN